ncbi:hypothetical protein M8J77_024471 [Diaphorina citri]|nr:hypothetical protein M8J77_024471 [Diaphorina citri]
MDQIKQFNKKVIPARDREILKSLPIFSQTQMEALNALQTELRSTIDNEILPMRNEIANIRDTERTFRKADVEKIESIMKTLQNTMNNLVIKNGSKFKEILGFPYEMEPDSSSSDSELSDEEFRKPSILTQPWYGDLLDEKRCRNTDTTSAGLGGMFDGIFDAISSSYVDARDCRRDEDTTMPPKLVVASRGENICDEFHPRLIYCDDPDEHRDHNNDDKNVDGN